MNIETASKFFSTVGEAVKAADIPCKQIEGYVQS